MQRLIANADERRHGQRSQADPRQSARHLLPQMPCGRQNITAMKNRKAIT